MSIVNATPKSLKTVFIGEICQVAGVVAGIAGVVLSLKHVLVALCLIGGAAAFYIGKKLRAD